jgi:hypothetical protein
MGGSVVVQTCPMLLDKKYRIAGVAVLDVVEGQLWSESYPWHSDSLEN